jgi:hypothetical protein
MADTNRVFVFHPVDIDEYFKSLRKAYDGETNYSVQEGYIVIQLCSDPISHARFTEEFRKINDRNFQYFVLNLLNAFILELDLESKLAEVTSAEMNLYGNIGVAAGGSFWAIATASAYAGAATTVIDFAATGGVFTFVGIGAYAAGHFFNREAIKGQATIKALESIVCDLQQDINFGSERNA